jgi:hypothetical protein
MTRQPTAEDAKLILQLYDLRREPRMREARRWLLSSFKAKTLQGFQRICPPGSEESASFRMVTTYWEMAASFVVSGILHERLFFENHRELLAVWETVREVASETRGANSDPAYLHNLEQVAGAYARWLDQASPGAFQALAARLRGGPAPATTAAGAPEAERG